ncbi:MAG: hypothetical protein AAGA75_25345 [Cyanobacteria bacterium P01_E01_bin.6]
MSPAPNPDKIPKSQRRRTEAIATDYVNILNDSVREGFEKLAQQQSELNLSIIQLTGQVRELAKQQERTAESLDGHLKLAQQQAKTAESQAANIAELTKLCTVLASRAG